MTDPIRERDWKYLRSLLDELLNVLCLRIIGQALEIAARDKENAHQRYLALFRHFQRSDDIVAECFNDWRRSIVGAVSSAFVVTICLRMST